MWFLDKFLSTFDELRAYADTAKYETITNPDDGVDYPGICADIPEHIKAEVISQVESALGRAIIPSIMFLRLSVEGTPVPQHAHTDGLMGEYSLMLYLHREKKGGTAFLSHKDTGLMMTPVSEFDVETLVRDQNTDEAWTAWEMCKAKPNRACIFNANLIHRAEPVGGFGKDARDGRLVLTMFFKVVPETVAA